LTLIADVAGLCSLASLAYYAFAAAAALRFARRPRQPPGPLPKILPRVAVLKPLHGRSASLEANLISCLETDYPRADFYFAVSDYEDPAAAVVVGLRARYQFIPITLVVGEEPGCANRKVAKLMRMAERAARDEILIIADADIVWQRDTIRRLVSALCGNERLGLVSCVYRSDSRANAPSRLEALIINTDFAPQVIVSEALEPVRHALGATIAVKRAALQAIGGFARLKDLLADDFYIGRLVADSGYEVRLADAVVTTVSDDRRLADVCKRQLRWHRTYRTVRPASVATILIEGPFWALIFLAATHASHLALAAFAAIIVARVVMAAVMMRQVLQLRAPTSDAFWVPLKDLLMVAIWFVSLFSNRVEWGGRRFTILRDGRLRELKG